MYRTPTTILLRPPSRVRNAYVYAKVHAMVALQCTQLNCFLWNTKCILYKSDELMSLHLWYKIDVYWLLLQCPQARVMNIHLNFVRVDFSVGILIAFYIVSLTVSIDSEQLTEVSLFVGGACKCSLCCLKKTHPTIWRFLFCCSLD